MGVFYSVGLHTQLEACMPTVELCPHLARDERMPGEMCAGDD